MFLHFPMAFSKLLRIFFEINCHRLINDIHRLLDEMFMLQITVFGYELQLLAEQLHLSVSSWH